MRSSPHDALRDLLNVPRGNLNEADTRHRVIDVILHEALAWPRNAVLCESYIAPGFTDYVLLDHTGSHLVFVEAKKEGAHFSLPRPSSKAKEDSEWVRVSELMTDSVTCTAMMQVREYCLNSGCEYAALTNGHEWIVFRTFSRGHDWRKMSAFCVRRIEYFHTFYTEARELLSYASIVDHASLRRAFDTVSRHHRPRFYPKEHIPAYDYEITTNHLAPALRPIANRYLGKMDIGDADFVDKCYVRRYREASYVQGVTRSIDDVLSPYFRSYNVTELFEEDAGGAIGARIASSARDRRTRDVVVLFGGKGSGKSTFIRKLLFHKPPEAIAHFSKIAVVDLLECPENPSSIETRIWESLLDGLDTDSIRKSPRDVLLRDLFSDRFAVAERQALSGLSPTSDFYNTRLNDLVSQWLSDTKYCSTRLANFWSRRRKGLIVVIDNTDQFTPAIQDLCFTIAQDVSTTLDCLVVVSMREERFYASKIHGTLDAFQNSGFHLPSPNPSPVFVRRLLYLLRLLDNTDRIRRVSPSLTTEQIIGVRTLFRIFVREFRSKTSHLRDFVTACAHGNMRVALEFFGQFLLSGYTRVDEMIANPAWTLQAHQVLRPMMVPYRMFYSERESSVPNVFQVRSDINGSHFTAIRILGMLRSSSSKSPVYVPVATLRSRFSHAFLMLDDLEKNLDVLLRSGMAESNNRVDFYSPGIDSIRITHFGVYVLDVLSCSFSYLELVSLDCGLHDEASARALSFAANREYDMFRDGDKAGRIALRVRRVETFLQYLKDEERLERDFYGLGAEEPLVVDVLERGFSLDRDRVVRSATKNYGKLNL